MTEHTASNEITLVSEYEEEIARLRAINAALVAALESLLPFLDELVEIHIDEYSRDYQAGKAAAQVAREALAKGEA